MDNSQAMVSSQIAPNQYVEEPRLTIASRWRTRLAYLAMSMFVGWHTLAMIVAPFPIGSEAVQSLRSLLQPYISLLRVDNQWSFFAPKVGRGGEFRYVVEASDGKRLVFMPTEEPVQSISHYFMWREWKYFYEKAMEFPDARAYLIGGLLCKKHAVLNPVSVSFLRVHELPFSVDDYLQGYRPNDPRFINVVNVANIDC